MIKQIPIGTRIVVEIPNHHLNGRFGVVASYRDDRMPQYGVVLDGEQEERGLVWHAIVPAAQA